MKSQINNDLFKNLVEATSSDLGIAEIIVEKDYMVSMLLERISKIDSLVVVFKGGTSLSKCYSVINRFSEDIDIGIEFNEAITRNAVKKLLKHEILKVIGDLGFELINESDILSRRDFNRYIVQYPRSFDDNYAVDPYIIIETIAIYEPYPIEMRNVSNYIADYINRSQNSELLKSKYAKNFSMLVQTIDRTFIDKLFAICDYYLNNNFNRYSRHIYDLHMIWNSGYLDLLTLRDLALIVARDRRTSSRNTSCIPGSRPNVVLLELNDFMTGLSTNILRSR